MKLREYQLDLIDKVKKTIIKGSKSVCVVLGCGGGKSIIQAMISKSATDKGNRVLFLVHRKELCEQITDTFNKCNVNMELCIIGMVQTLTNKIESIDIPAIIITDETHHSLASSYKNIYNKFPESIKLGFTATPQRMNEGGLGSVYNSMVEGVSVKYLIDNKYLSPYKYFSVPTVDTCDLKISRGEFDTKQVNILMEDNVVFGKTYEHYLKLAEGKKTIIYCASISSSIETIGIFESHGIKCAHLDAKSKKSERAEIVNKFKNGEITVLSNVDLFGEGFDVPDCECVILLRPTQSLTLHVQQSMRAMRYMENKTAIIIDHVGNVIRHGLPDEDRTWSLESKKKKNKELSVKQCPKCYFTMPINALICPECGEDFTKQVKEAEEKKILDVELQLLTAENLLKMKPYNHYKKIRSFEAMDEFRKAKGYKFSWAIHKCIEIGIDIPSKYDYMRRYLNERTETTE